MHCLLLYVATSKAIYWTASPWSYCGDFFVIGGAASWTYLWSNNKRWLGEHKCFVVLANWDACLCLSGCFFATTLRIDSCSVPWLIRNCLLYDRGTFNTCQMVLGLDSSSEMELAWVKVEQLLVWYGRIGAMERGKQCKLQVLLVCKIVSLISVVHVYWYLSFILATYQFSSVSWDAGVSWLVFCNDLALF